jgi:hypothetical protein
VILPGAAHIVTVESPVAANEQIQTFLNGDENSAKFRVA